MKNSKLISIMAVAITCASFLVGCSSTDTSTTDITGTTEELQKEENKVTDSNNLTVEGEHASVTLTDVKVVKDDEGNDALEITYTFTNKDEEPTSAIFGVTMEVFQNGKSQDVAFMPYDENNEYLEQVELMTGVSQENCKAYYQLQDMSTVTLKVYETFGSAWKDDKDLPTFEIDLNSNTITRVN